MLWCVFISQTSVTLTIHWIKHTCQKIYHNLVLVFSLHGNLWNELTMEVEGLLYQTFVIYFHALFWYFTGSLFEMLAFCFEVWIILFDIVWFVHWVLCSCIMCFVDLIYLSLCKYEYLNSNFVNCVCIIKNWTSVAQYQVPW